MNPACRLCRFLARLAAVLCLMSILPWQPAVDAADAPPADTPPAAQSAPQLVLLREVPKPALPADQPDRRARTQPSVPDTCKPVPFVDTAPEPELTADESKRGFLLFQRDNLDPIYASTHPRPEERLAALTAFATPGEFEPVSFGVYPVRDLQNFRVQCSALTAGDKTIPAAAIDVRLVTYWNIGFPKYDSRDRYRLKPELLEAVTVNNAQAKQCQRYWLTIHVPADATPGLYRGTVTVWDDPANAAVEIPLAIRVLGFQLRSDPAKHFSTYYYPHNAVSFKGKDETFIDRASANEYQAMRDFGLNMLPTMSLTCEDGKTIELQNAGELDRMLKAGLRGPLPVTADRVIRKLYLDAIGGGRVQPHWVIPQTPPASLFPAITAAFKAFEQTRRDRGWPDIVCCPMDEVSATGAEFGAQVFAAVKAAGIRTYATKDPLAVDAFVYQNAVDIWCSQPYSVSYPRIVAQTRHEYWSYPNHNAGEIKDPVVMCKGGRMTYGFGLWRAGYTTLIPWHWSWTPGNDPFDYLRGPRSGCGMRIDDDGTVIPAVNWECFREGIDDGRYIYTLQAAVNSRAQSTDPVCRDLVAAARRLLDETWASVQVQSRYLDEGLWASGDFNAVRWRMAALTDQLLQFPEVDVPTGTAAAPSVLVTPSVVTPNPDAEMGAAAMTALAQGTLDADLIQARNLAADWKDWACGTKESAVAVLPDAGRKAPSPGLRWSVTIDYKHDGDNSLDGKYPVGWPRLSRQFADGALDITAYDKLSFWIRIDSDRDEVADDRTPVVLLIRSHKAKGKFQKVFDFGDKQRQWIQVEVPIADIVQATGGAPELWKAVSEIQLFLSESDYRDGTKLTFDLDGIALQRYKVPTLGRLDAARLLLLPARQYAVDFEVQGASAYKPGSHRVRAEILDANEKVLARVEQDLAAAHHLALDATAISPGAGQLRLAILDADGKPCSQNMQPVTYLWGPLVAPRTQYK